MPDASQLLAQFLSGLSYASTLFLVSSGLSIIFGVTRIVNFAHGSFYMLGAYIASSLIARLPHTPFGFWTSVALAAVAVGLVGIVMELLILRRIYRAPELFQILATFGVILIVQDVVQMIWGTEDIFSSRAPGLSRAVEIMGQLFPQYDLALIAFAPLMLLVLWLVLYKTRWGVLVRAATQDREMAAALGINQSLLFTSVVFLGCLLAGLAGALQVPKDAANLQMDLNIITETFVVVVIGGLGSVLGAFLAALLIGQTHAFGLMVLPSLTLVMTFLLMAIVLVVWPLGFLGRAEKAARLPAVAVEPLREADWRVHLAAGAVVLLLLAAPAVLNEYGQIILTEIFLLAVFAASLHFLMSVGGMVSFGHAAFFGLGAYAAGWLAASLGTPIFAAVAAGVAAAAAAGAVIGWFCTRLSGVYLAFLTLAFAQILWSIAVQWVSVTGGDNGILGVRAPAWLASSLSFYYFALLASAAALWAMRRLVFAPFGYTLRAGRDSLMRADSTGIDVRRHQWASFVVSGMFAGLAGGLIAFQRGRVFPNDISLTTSVDSLVMVLLGGIGTISGPVVGAGAYHLLRTELIRHFEDHWRLILGVVIVLLVVIFPSGIAGGLKQLAGARLRPGKRA
ncbi:MAG TPA: ABC transporter permease [Xanthobacteraceae bacterium]|jgi:branched-chain amino acid transport system permease protein